MIQWHPRDDSGVERRIRSLDDAKPTFLDERCPRSQYTAWAFGQGLRAAGLLGSMGRVASALENSMMESFFDTLQLKIPASFALYPTPAIRTEIARIVCCNAAELRAHDIAGDSSARTAVARISSDPVWP